VCDFAPTTKDTFIQRLETDDHDDFVLPTTKGRFADDRFLTPARLWPKL